MNIIRVGYLSGGNTLMVNVESGAVVSATNGTKTVTGVSVDGLCKLRVQAGTWTVIATKGSDVSQPVEVVVTDSYSMEMSFGLKLSSLPVGAFVRMKENGTDVNYRVVHQGLPSSMYDASCNGTWVLREAIHSNKEWDSTNNDYKNSDIHNWLNGTFLGTLNVQSLIKQVKIPCHNGVGNNGSVASGSNGLSVKIFLLGGYEVAWTTSTNSAFPVDGACLSYFNGCAKVDAKRIAYLNGTATQWHLRSPVTADSSRVWCVHNSGDFTVAYSTNSFGIRPAFVLPADALCNPEPNADGSYTLVA